MPEDPFQDFLRSAGRDFNRSKPAPPPLTEREWRKVRDGFQREFPAPPRPGLLARLHQHLRRLLWTPVLVPVAALALVLVMLLQDSTGNLEFRYSQPSAQTRDPDTPAELSTLQRLVDNDLALNLDLRRGHVRLTLADGTILEGRADFSAAQPDALRLVTLAKITVSGRTRSGEVLAGTLEISLRLKEDAPPATDRLTPGNLRWSKMVLDLTAPNLGTNRLVVTRQAVP